MKKKTDDILIKKSVLTLPFYFEATKKNDNDGFIQTFPFKLKYDKTIGMFYQAPSPTLEKLLSKAYLVGTMLSGGMNDVYIGKSRVNSAFEFIKKTAKFKAGSVLEIGCGEGQILKLLSGIGFDCTGLEPGPQVEKIDSAKIKVVKDFFPSGKIKSKYDLIMHFGVIEHIPNPVKFLKDQLKYLNNGGEIICGFPNCESDLKNGDISLFLHEHYNYFSKDSFVRIAKKAGFSVASIEESPAGGMIHAKLVRKNNNIRRKNSFYRLSPAKFEKNADKLKKSVKKFFGGVQQNQVAVYCPLRCMNLFYSLGISNCRLVDDNPSLQNKYLPTFKNPIENLSQLKKTPPKKILIYSRTYDKIIKKKLSEINELKTSEIKTILELKP